jgi:hypothetical protein
MMYANATGFVGHFGKPSQIASLGFEEYTYMRI